MARSGGHKTKNRLEQSGLAGAVWTEQSGATLGYFNRQVIERNERPILDNQVLDRGDTHGKILYRVFFWLANRTLKSGTLDDILEGKG